MIIMILIIQQNNTNYKLCFLNNYHVKHPTEIIHSSSVRLTFVPLQDERLELVPLIINQIYVYTLNTKHPKNRNMNSRVRAIKKGSDGEETNYCSYGISLQSPPCLLTLTDKNTKV